MSVSYHNILATMTPDATPTPLIIITAPERGLVDVRLRVNAVDGAATPVEFKSWDVNITAARNGGTTLSISASLDVIRASSGAGSWTITPVDNSDGTFAIRITGAAGRNIVWGQFGEVLTLDYDAWTW